MPLLFSETKLSLLSPNVFEENTDIDIFKDSKPSLCSIPLTMGFRLVIHTTSKVNSHAMICLRTNNLVLRCNLLNRLPCQWGFGKYLWLRKILITNHFAVTKTWMSLKYLVIKKFSLNTQLRGSWYFVKAIFWAFAT